MLSCFLPTSPDSHFPINNLPLGVFSSKTNPNKRVGVAISTLVLDLSAVVRHSLFTGAIAQETCFDQDSLNAFLACGASVWADTRAQVTTLLSADCATLRDNKELQQAVLVPQEEVTMHLPLCIGDYTDFYLSKEHAVNCTRLFRGADTPLQPNWSQLPVAYHGRASSVIVSGHPIHRPRGQVQSDSGVECVPSRVLDFELEMAAVVGQGNTLGHPIPIENALDHVFGLVLLNDWSARDVQKWEYVPLGPFNGKNFDPAPLPYLKDPVRSTYDIQLQALLQPAGATHRHVVTTSNFKHLYWTLAQMVAHHTIGGCNLRPGDLLGTGTISTTGAGGAGCLLEATWGGRDALDVGHGQQRTFLQDGDEVILTGWCQGAGYRVGFGECAGTVLPAL